MVVDVDEETQTTHQFIDRKNWQSIERSKCEKVRFFHCIVGYQWESQIGIFSAYYKTFLHVIFFCTKLVHFTFNTCRSQVSQNDDNGIKNFSS